MSRTWLSIRVDLIGGGGQDLWPRRGRILAASRSHTLPSWLPYEFDFGDSWEHLCTVGPTRIDPIDQLGILPQRPLPYWGWGVIPDQYGRLWVGDDGEGDSNPGPDPRRADPPAAPHVGATPRPIAWARSRSNPSPGTALAWSVEPLKRTRTTVRRGTWPT